MSILDNEIQTRRAQDPSYLDESLRIAFEAGAHLMYGALTGDADGWKDSKRVRDGWTNALSRALAMMRADATAEEARK